MEEFYTYDPNSNGSKGLVFIGKKILVYRRDNNTKVYPLYIDLPGGGPEPKETPFETFRREVMEEFGLVINREDIMYVRKYESILEKGKFLYFPVAKLPSDVEPHIKFGNEGLEYMLMSLNEFVGLQDAWPVLQSCALDYINATIE